MTEPLKTNCKTAGENFDYLVEIMRTLRSPNGCPWDREQTLSSLRAFILEETYEVLDAIDQEDMEGLRDEIGDLVFETVFLAQLCTESNQFTITDSLASVIQKLIRRHPHVFGDSNERGSITTSEDVKNRWEEIKANERMASGKPPRLLESIPVALPALLRAYRIGKRTATIGFDWNRQNDVMKKVDEELSELTEAIEKKETTKIDEELGDLLFTIANLARHLGIEPEAALRRANQKFSRRFTELEQRFQKRSIPLKDVSVEEMNQEWKKIKQATNS